MSPEVRLHIMMMVTLGDDQATDDVTRVAYIQAEDAIGRKVACSIGSPLHRIVQILQECYYRQ